MYIIHTAGLTARQHQATNLPRVFSSTSLASAPLRSQVVLESPNPARNIVYCIIYNITYIYNYIYIKMNYN